MYSTKWYLIRNSLYLYECNPRSMMLIYLFVYLFMVYLTMLSITDCTSLNSRIILYKLEYKINNERVMSFQIQLFFFKVFIKVFHSYCAHVSITYNNIFLMNLAKFLPLL